MRLKMLLLTMVFLTGCDALLAGAFYKHDDAKRIKLLRDCMQAALPEGVTMTGIPDKMWDGCMEMAEEDSRIR